MNTVWWIAFNFCRNFLGLMICANFCAVKGKLHNLKGSYQQKPALRQGLFSCYAERSGCKQNNSSHNYKVFGNVQNRFAHEQNGSVHVL